ncbi:glycosyltransferase, partial [Salmonella enterica]
KKFVGDFSANLHALPFSPCPELNWLNDNSDLIDKYAIDKDYFIICNQFWKHKDHSTAFKAFKKYIEINPDVYLVCTGATQDYRFPGYFDELMCLLKKLGISEKVKILGHIPKLEQIELIKNSIAVIQPTLFEGGPGGGITFDA